jgi:hypothetical protein
LGKGRTREKGEGEARRRTGKGIREKGDGGRGKVEGRREK